MVTGLLVARRGAFPELDSKPARENTLFLRTVTDDAHLYGLWGMDRSRPVSGNRELIRLDPAVPEPLENPPRATTSPMARDARRRVRGQD
ncbi:hypothetical protein FDG2_0454 [Candidatus Protofrankia californiensis]|uniref:Uncharacterized protein n=1 Tax=Candidatus Protofrankia californiensis TaxID=1839754 RepID=A0A1C3NTQ5_9ACTN|nr:hypothetical protein FDG2_0454 [Candidatus Protofrankia californiensis]